MDGSEKLVEEYLKSLGFGDVRYQPDGNVTPDFLVDGRIAVEVRRLNSNYFNDGGEWQVGLEKAAKPLWRHVREYLTGLGPAPASGQSWFVSFRFGRPVPAWKPLRRALDGVLRPFMSHPIQQPFERQLDVPGELRIRVFKSPIRKQAFFALLGASDMDEPSWLIEKIERNLNYCIAQKSLKIKAFRAKYPEWWLILPDHIGYSLYDLDQRILLEKSIKNPGAFDQIMLLDPLKTNRAFQVHPSSGPLPAFSCKPSP